MRESWYSENQCLNAESSSVDEEHHLLSLSPGGWPPARNPPVPQLRQSTRARGQAAAGAAGGSRRLGGVGSAHGRTGQTAAVPQRLSSWQLSLHARSTWVPNISILFLRERDRKGEKEREKEQEREKGGERINASNCKTLFSKISLGILLREEFPSFPANPKGNQVLAWV